MNDNYTINVLNNPNKIKTYLPLSNEEMFQMAIIKAKALGKKAIDHIENRMNNIAQIYCPDGLQSMTDEQALTIYKRQRAYLSQLLDGVEERAVFQTALVPPLERLFFHCYNLGLDHNVVAAELLDLDQCFVDELSEEEQESITHDLMDEYGICTHPNDYHPILTDEDLASDYNPYQSVA